MVPVVKAVWETWSAAALQAWRVACSAEACSGVGRSLTRITSFTSRNLGRGESYGQVIDLRTLDRMMSDQALEWLLRGLVEIGSPLFCGG